MKVTSTMSSVIARFAGDSGDGMQLLGTEWVKACALSQNDLATSPDFPAEIRAPAGTLAGVSGFQIQFAATKVHTAGDRPDVLVALNPAALKANIRDLKRGGLLILNQPSFSELALTKAGYESNPLTDESLSDYQVMAIDMNGILREALKECGISPREVQKCKNFFSLGLMYWLYAQDREREVKFIAEKFKNNAELKEANTQAFLAGFAYGENTEAMPAQTIVPKAPLSQGIYRTITGNKAMALGLIAASQKAGLSLFYASYPITPASDILHELAAMRAFGANTYQVEDEMAAICACIGASFAGSLSATATSGPGFALKAEALGYAVMVELPLIVVDVQRAGPSTGMPTKTEQSDLMQAIYGRSGDAPLVVIAPTSPQDCFNAAIDAARIAVEFMTPVVILSDAHIANCSAPWRVVDPDDIPEILPQTKPISEPFKPYERNACLSRAWVRPGTKGGLHQLGGLEKDKLSGRVSYVPQNHQEMCQIRRQKIANVADALPMPEIFGDQSGDVLLVGFGGTFGALHQATIDLQESGYSVSHLHIRLLNPLHEQIGAMMKKFRHVVVAEQNHGQLASLLRAKFLIDVQSFVKMTGQPFLVSELTDHLMKTYLAKTANISNIREHHYDA